MEALLGFAVLLALLFLRVPIVFAMGIVGFTGFGILVNWPAAFSMVGTVAYETGLSYTLSVVPMFILMGNFVTHAALSRKLYDASHAFLGHRRGGLAMATIVACGGFSAVCGSSLATAATMAKVAMPSMRKYGYADSLSVAAIAAGGTLGILIPPSVILILYGIMTEQNIGMLFAAGILPGVLGIALYLAAIWATTAINPRLGPRGERTGWPQRWRAVKQVWDTVLLFAVVMGGIYGGIFTPTEAAGVGASGAFFLALLRGNLTIRLTYLVLVETFVTTVALFAVLIGALIFSNFVNLTTLPQILLGLSETAGVTPAIIVAGILVIYFLLGCVLESLSMILLTVPLFYPVVAGLGMDLVWFGIIVVVATEISLITPPVGLNIFVLKSMLPDVKLGTVFKGVTPFWLADLVRLAILAAFPPVALALPRLLF